MFWRVTSITNARLSVQALAALQPCQGRRVRNAHQVAVRLFSGGTPSSTAASTGASTAFMLSVKSPVGLIVGAMPACAGTRFQQCSVRRHSSRARAGNKPKTIRVAENRWCAQLIPAPSQGSPATSSWGSSRSFRRPGCVGLGKVHSRLLQPNAATAPSGTRAKPPPLVCS